MYILNLVLLSTKNKNMKNTARQLLSRLPHSEIYHFSLFKHYFGRALFQFRTLPTWIKVSTISALLCVPALTFGSIFLAPDSVAFSFNSQTCVTKPSLFPGVNSPKPGSIFDLEQVPDFSFGTTPVYSSKTCIHLKQQPDELITEQLVIKTPLGLATTIEVNTPILPKLVETDAIDPNISGANGMLFKLNIVDTTFDYALEINGQNLGCNVNDSEIWCPFNDMGFTQGTLYPYSLKRLFAETTPTTIYSASAQTSEPIAIAPAAPKNDETILTPIQAITLSTNKPIKSLDEVSLQTSSGVPVPFQTTSNGTTITITANDPLTRESSFTLTIALAQAVDSGYLAAPFTLTFHTSGGPKVTGINIPKVAVPLSSQLVITTDIDLLAEQNIAAIINVTAGGTKLNTDVAINRNKIIVTPTSTLPKCTEFTVALSAGSVSVYGIGGSQAWTYTARSICHEKITIGGSFAGRGITAYKFGSGNKTTLFIGGLHGSEKSSVRTLEAWVNDLEAQIQRIPADKTIIVIPNTNPDGYSLGSRTNARGIDLNRNFPSNDWSSDVYQPGGVLLPGGGGASALSEPESSALALYIQSVSPEVVLTYHAVARTVIYNGSGNSANLANLYAQKSGFNVSSSDQEDGIFNYATTGELETWLHDSLNVPTLLIENATMSSNELPKQSPAMWAMVEN